jgi:hypothetical protein
MNDHELVIEPKVTEPLKRQWYVTETGEYECPHYALTEQRMCSGDEIVMLTDDEANNLRDIEALYQEQQGFLESMYFPSGE